MAFQELPASLTPREAEQMAYEKEMFEKQAAFQLRQLELEAKWTSWLRIPVTIIKLPVYCLMAIGFIVGVAVKKDMPDDFWKLMR